MQRLCIWCNRKLKKLCCVVDNMNYHRGPMNQRWPQDRYDFRGGYGRGRGPPPFRGGGSQRTGWYPRGSGDYGDRGRRYTRSSSRSHSRSPSPRSRSRSFSRSSDERGSRSRSDDSRENARKRRVSFFLFHLYLFLFLTDWLTAEGNNTEAFSHSNVSLR